MFYFLNNSKITDLIICLSSPPKQLYLQFQFIDTMNDA